MKIMVYALCIIFGCLIGRDLGIWIAEAIADSGQTYVGRRTFLLNYEWGPPLMGVFFGFISGLVLAVKLTGDDQAEAD